MSEIIDLILSNLFLVAIIVGGLIKFLGDMGQSKEENKKPANKPQQRPTPRPTPTPSGPIRIPNMPNKSEVRDLAETTVQTVSIEEQQKRQLEQLAGKINSNIQSTLSNLDNHDSIKDNQPTLLERIKNDNSNQEKFKKQMKRQFSRNGLIEGIIMAEVLGPPRAKKTFQSVTSERLK